MKLLLGLIGLVIVISALTLWRAGQQEARAEARFPPLGDRVDVGGVPVHYLQMGEGPDIVLIHGASGNLRDFSFDLMEQLSDRYRVTAFDRPGLGYTPRIDRDGASIFQQADLLASAAAELGIEAPIVLGHSYGGAVALAWGTRHSGATSALVLLAAASNPWDTPLSTYYRVLSHPVAGPLVIPALTAWVPDRVVEGAVESIFTPQSAPAGYSDYIGGQLALRRASMRENALQRASILEEVRTMVPNYAGITVPVEILHGTEDDTVWLTIHSEPLSTQIADANLVAMEGVGHSPHHAEPDTVIAAIDRAAARAGLR